MKTIGIVGCVLVVAAAGCASSPPAKEVVAARAAYDNARNGPAAQLDPSDLMAAKHSLDIAEQSYASTSNSSETKALAYAAERRAETADASARERQAVVDRGRAMAMLQSERAQQLSITSAELEQTKERLQQEEQRRQQAEQEAQKMQQDLQHVAQVHREQRGTVITVPGSLLFASGKANLMTPAHSKLDQVATELNKVDKTAKIIIEGHTDSTGPASLNQDLSQKRADSVRDYLVSKGVSGDRITAEGFGATRPIASNASTEGRATNRRVDIIVENPQDQGQQPQQPPSGGPSTTSPKTP